LLSLQKSKATADDENTDGPKDLCSSNLQRDLMAALECDENDAFHAALALQVIGELHCLKRRKARKVSKRFSWTITEDVALLSATSNSVQLIKNTDAAGFLASVDSIKERIRYLKPKTECTRQFLNET